MRRNIGRFRRLINAPPPPPPPKNHEINVGRTRSPLALAAAAAFADTGNKFGQWRGGINLYDGSAAAAAAAQFQVQTRPNQTPTVCAFNAPAPVEKESTLFNQPNLRSGQQTNYSLAPISWPASRPAAKSAQAAIMIYSPHFRPHVYPFCSPPSLDFPSALLAAATSGSLTQRARRPICVSARRRARFCRRRRRSALCLLGQFKT